MMAGLNDTDIKLDANWQLTSAANGDAPVATGRECLLQDIKLEALTQAGEVFYDEDWGWSLLDFIQSQDDDLIRLEIDQRVKVKLSKRTEINSDTIQTEIHFFEDKITLGVRFRFVSSNQEESLEIELDRVKVEVISI